jgi:hypothetical protein
LSREQDIALLDQRISELGELHDPLVELHILVSLEEKLIHLSVRSERILDGKAGSRAIRTLSTNSSAMESWWSNCNAKEISEKVSGEKPHDMWSGWRKESISWRLFCVRGWRAVSMCELKNSHCANAFHSL